jgi:hypothetical protein
MFKGIVVACGIVVINVVGIVVLRIVVGIGV